MRYELRVLLLLAVFFGLIVWFMPTAEARAVAIATSQGISITVTDEPCRLKQVSNLPYRVTWKDGNKTFEGCFTVRPDVNVVVAYFDDGSVALIPAHAFSMVSES